MALPQLPSQRSGWVFAITQWLATMGQPILLATVAASACLLGGRGLGLLQGLELATYDHFIRLRPALEPDDRLLIVGITEADIQSRQEWPTTDQTLAEAITRVLAAEPRVVGLDIFRDIPIGEGRESLLTAINSSDRVFTVCKISSRDNSGVAPPPEGVSEQVGFSDFVVDRGGILRRNLIVATPPDGANSTGTHLCNTSGNVLFSLGLQLALAYLREEGIGLEQTEKGELRLGDTVIPRLDGHMGGYQGVDTGGYQMMLNYRAVTDAVPQVSLGDLLAGTVPSEKIRDRIVLIGATTPEAKDHFYTPYSGSLDDSQIMLGIMVHAQATSQILSAVLDMRSQIWSWGTGGESAWIVLWGLIGAVLAGSVRRPLWFGLGAIALGGSLYGISFLLFLEGGWIPLVPAALNGTIAVGGVLLVDRFNRSAYGQAVYRQVKSFLRIKIEIDEEQLLTQVAEIADTDYFNQLQQRAEDFRRHLKTPVNQRPSAPSPSPSAASSSEDKDPETYAEDYLETLRQEAQRLKSPLPADPSSSQNPGAARDE